MQLSRLPLWLSGSIQLISSLCTLERYKYKKDLPDNPVLQAWETPWQLVGPVLPGEKLIEQPTLPEGTYTQWSGKVVYEAGDRVLFDGIPFQAKWWNEGESPAASAANPDSSPWLALSQNQIVEILKEIEAQ